MDSDGGPLSGSKPGSAAGNNGLAARFAVLLERSGVDPSWAGALAAADPSGFPDLLRRMESLPAGQRERLREFLLGRWVALDPEGGAEFFKAAKDEGGLSELFRHWQRLDFPKAAVKAGEYGGTLLRRTLRDKALLDPAGLLTWLGARPDLNPLEVFSSGGEENTKALIRLAGTDPAKMLAWTRQVPEGKWDRDFVSGLAARLAGQHPEEALAWAQSVRDPAASAAALAGVAGTLMPADPERALSLLAALPESGDYESNRRLGEAIRKLDVRDKDRAVELARALPEKGAVRGEFIQRALDRLMASDPAAAFAFAETPEAGLNAVNRGRIPTEAQSPEGARRILDAAEKAGDTAYRESAARQAMMSWLEREPGTLAAWLRGKEDTPLLSGMREQLRTALAVQQRRDGAADPELVALVGLPPSAMVKSAYVIDAAEAAPWLERIEDPAERQRLAVDTARQYVYQDRAQAMAWAETVKDPTVQAAAWKVIAADWVAEDSWRASEWIAGLPRGAGRDSAVQAMAESIGKTDPDLAWTWALSMDDPGLKSRSLNAAARTWAQKDAASLRQAVEEAALSPQERQSVLESLKAPSGSTPGAGQ